MNKIIHASEYLLYQLLTAARGSVHNCMFIECSNCAYNKKDFCSDFIFTTAYDGAPILMPTKDINLLIGHSLDKLDYLGFINNSRFYDLFFLYLNEFGESEEECPIIKLFTYQNDFYEKYTKKIRTKT